METKKKERIVEETVYVAEDGTEFDRKYLCEEYEENLKRADNIVLAERLRIKRLDDVLPLDDDGVVEQNNVFRWYKLNTKEDFEALNGACGGDLREPEEYPEIMCVETCSHEAYNGQAYCYDISTCKKITKEFWNQLGYDVTFERNGKWDDV